jgi:hypothetical protein
MGVTGEVMALQGDKAELAVAGKRLKIATSDLVGLDNKQPGGVWGGEAPPGQGKPGKAGGVSGSSFHGRPPSSTGSVSFPTKSVPAELKLIGLTVEEAQDSVAKFLDDAALSDRRELRLVHGFGEGKLRRAVAQLLDAHPLVASWRPGGPSEGGGGATIVELRD